MRAQEGAPRAHRGSSGTLRSRFARAVVLLTVVGAASPVALADNTADEADLRFRRGVEAYRAGKYEDALSEFFHSNRLVRNLNVITNIARCYEQLKMFDEAYRYYSEVLSGAPRPEDRRLVTESLARLGPRVALLQVSSTPPGADIFVERKDLGSLGVTPKTLALRAGEARVLLSLPGHREAQQVVHLVSGRTASAHLALDYIWGEVRLSGGPVGAEVRVDRTEGPPEASIPGVLKVKPGKHVLYVSASGYLASQLPVDVQGDLSAEVAVALQPLPLPTGNVMVTANHEGALVRVDGRESGFTPAVIALPAGPHRIEVHLADMRPFERRVEVIADQTARLQAQLRFAGAKTTAASKVETSADEAPASITVISREELRALGYQTLTEALRGVRGLFWSYDRQYEQIGVRGFSALGNASRRVLVLYDGHPVGDIVGGTAFVGRDLEVDLAEVERIEVVRGPVSSLYGTSAVFGVVNLVPRRHLGDRLVEGTAAAGSLGTVGGRATGAYRGESGEVLLSIGGARVGGDTLYEVPLAETLVVRDQDREVAFHGTARARWKGFSLLADFNSREKLLPTGASNTVIGQWATRVRDQHAAAELRFEHRLPGGSLLAARLYYDAHLFQGKWMYSQAEQIDQTRGDWGGFELRFRTGEILRQHLTVGVEVQEQFRVHMGVRTGDVPGIDDTRAFTILSAYLDDELRVANALLVNASVRADEYFGSFGLTVNPRLALIARPLDGAVTKLMGGKSFRAPSAYERYYHDGIVNPDTGAVGSYFSLKPNPDLKPESVYTVELEHAQDIGNDFKATASLYVNWITDLLGYAPDPADGLLRTVNATGTVRTQGAELELRWQPQRLAMLSASYSFQRMVLSGVSDPGEQARLRNNAPAHMFALRAMFPISAPLIVGSAEVLFNSARPLRDGSGSSGEMLGLNAGLSGELPGGRFRYFAGARNILDERAELPGGPDVPQLTIPTYGRTFVLQLTASY
ncbi:MAG: TonB-dependent receptor [Deltaproteobacteria bacterium]|nr:TonB-dependent receptor [Deltaproteobacteria bacterium]